MATKKASNVRAKARTAPRRAPKRAPKRTAKPRVAAPRKDLGAKIDGYLAKLKGPVHGIAEALVALVQGAVPQATAELKWGMPVFSHRGLLCYVRAQAGYVRFGFYDHARAMEDPGGRLEGGGNGKHVKIAALQEVDRDRFASWLRTAARLNASRAV
jgi:hypothetical protein